MLFMSEQARLKQGCFEKGLCCVLILSLALSVPVSSYAAPPEGRGQGNESHGNGNGNGQENSNNGNHGQQAAFSHGNHGNSLQERSSQASSSRRDPLHQFNQRSHFYGHKTENLGLRDFAEPSTGNHGDRDTVRNVSHNRQNRSNEKEHVHHVLVRQFETTLEQLRKNGKGPWGNPRADGLPRENHSHLEMLDPYGLSRDDRMELYGNRGRPIRESVEEPPPEEPPTEEPPPEEPPTEEPPPEEPPPEEPPPPEPQYITVTAQTLEIMQYLDWNGSTLTSQMLRDLGYTDAEITFVLTLSTSQISLALQGDGRILLP